MRKSGDAGPRLGGPGLAFGQMRDAPRYARRAVDQRDVRADDCPQLLLQQREVGAGEDDDVDRVAPGLVA